MIQINNILKSSFDEANNFEQMQNQTMPNNPKSKKSKKNSITSINQSINQSILKMIGSNMHKDAMS